MWLKDEIIGRIRDTPVNPIQQCSDAWEVLRARLGSEVSALRRDFVNVRREIIRRRMSAPDAGEDQARLLEDLKRRYLETQSQGVKDWLEKYMSQKSCEDCGGKRLKPEVLGVTVAGKNIWDLSCLSVTDSLNFFENIKFNENEQKII